VRRIAAFATCVALTTIGAFNALARAGTGEPTCRPDTRADRSSFADEAAHAGFQVTFEQTAPPMAYKQAQVVGVFAAKRTLAEANALMQRLAPVGFRYIDIARTPTRWLVVMPEVPVKQALPIAREVSTAGFQITFRSGAK
jgi:hypothetical protein